MELLVGVGFLIIGATLAVIASGRLCAKDPYGLVSHTLGDLTQADFFSYLIRAFAFFLLVVSAALAQPTFGFWALLMLLIGGFPSFIMVRQHNKRVLKLWRPR